MKKLVILSAIGLVSLVGCTKQEAAAPLCDVLFKSVTAAAQGVAGALDCTNVPSIAATLWKPITQNLKLCADTGASGLVGDLVCGQVSKAVIGIGVNTLPADWQCKGGSIGDQAAKIIEDKCKQSVPF